MKSRRVRTLAESILWIAPILISFFGVFYFEEMSRAMGVAAESKDEAAPLSPLVPGEERLVRVFSDGYGHFEVEALIRGRPVDFVVDTGATAVALTFEDAKRLGLARDLRFTGTTQTANGLTRVAPIVIPAVRVGDIQIKNVRAHVAAPGNLTLNLLGMSFIRRLKRFEMAGGVLTLVQ